MNIEAYCDVLNLELRICRYPNQGNRYTASFEDCETKDNVGSIALESTYGNGKTAHEAITNYVEKIRGRLLVVNAMSKDNRREYVVPKELTA